MATVTAGKGNTGRGGFKFHFEHVAWSVLGILLILALWEIAAAYLKSVNPYAERLFPSWTTILTRSWQELAVFASPGEPNVGPAAAVGVIIRASLTTASEVAAGTTIGLVAGFAIGLLLCYSSTFALILGPLVSVMRPFPLLALLSLFTIWFGGEAIGILLFVAFASFVMTVVASFHAALNTPPIMTAFAQTLGANRRQLFQTVVIPSMLPELFGTLRNVAALSWSFALGGEYTGAQGGLGFLLYYADKFAFLGRLVVIVALFSIFAVIIDALLMLVRRWIIRWAPV